MAKIAEWSANFDYELLDTLLSRVVSGSGGVVSESHRRQVMDFVRAMKLDEEKPISFEVQHKGERTSLGFRVFMDDIEAPDVTVFAPPEITDLFRAEYLTLCDELGI